MRRTLTALVASATAALAVTVPSASVAPTADAAVVKYVALGDSYSAASGVLPLDLSSPFCARSTVNYPHLIASKTGYAFTDVTCGAAETTHFRTSQHPGVAPQLDAVTSGTGLVTMTIGGNDSSVFFNAIIGCGRLGITSLGQGSPCKDQYGSTFVDTIKKVTYPSLVRALKAVHAKAPRARVAIIGYPWIMPAKGGCYPQMPVATGDVPYLRNMQWTLNDAVRRAAAATGSIYVNMNKVSDGHDACKPIGTRWVEPAVLGTNPVIVHPNALGERKMAGRTMAVLGIQ